MGAGLVLLPHPQPLERPPGNVQRRQSHAIAELPPGDHFLELPISDLVDAQVFGFLEALATGTERGCQENVTNLTREARVNDVVSQLAEAPGAAPGLLFELLPGGRCRRKTARAAPGSS